VYKIGSCKLRVLGLSNYVRKLLLLLINYLLMSSASSIASSLHCHMSTISLPREICGRITCFLTQQPTVLGMFAAVQIIVSLVSINRTRLYSYAIIQQVSKQPAHFRQQPLKAWRNPYFVSFPSHQLLSRKPSEQPISNRPVQVSCFYQLTFLSYNI
jgi:hypothetical protein